MSNLAYSFFKTIKQKIESVSLKKKFPKKYLVRPRIIDIFREYKLMYLLLCTRNIQKRKDSIKKKGNNNSIKKVIKKVEFFKELSLYERLVVFVSTSIHIWLRSSRFRCISMRAIYTKTDILRYRRTTRRRRRRLGSQGWTGVQ